MNELKLVKRKQTYVDKKTNEEHQYEQVLLYIPNYGYVAIKSAYNNVQDNRILKYFATESIANEND